jgi:hypothetical protein
LLLMTVAGAVLAAIAAWISAFQSMVEDRLLPDVVMVLDEPELLLGLEAALLTVMIEGPFVKKTGPASCRPGSSLASRTA